MSGRTVADSFVLLCVTLGGGEESLPPISQIAPQIILSQCEIGSKHHFTIFKFLTILIFLALNSTIMKFIQKILKMLEMFFNLLKARTKHEK